MFQDLPQSLGADDIGLEDHTLIRIKGLTNTVDLSVVRAPKRWRQGQRFETRPSPADLDGMVHRQRDSKAEPFMA